MPIARIKISIFMLLLAFGLFGSMESKADVKQYPLADFYKQEKFKAIKISPSGEYLAATVERDEGTDLVIIRLSDMKVTARASPADNNHVTDFNWVNDHRVLFDMSWKGGSLSSISLNFMIYGLNVDGPGPDTVGYGELIDTLMHDDEKVLIYPYRFKEVYGARIGNRPPARLMDVNTGEISGTKAMSPRINDCDLSFDQYGEPRFASCAKRAEITQSFFYRANKDSKWELINDQAVTGRNIAVRGYSSDGKSAYLQIEEEQGPDAVYLFDMGSRQKTFLMKDDVVDPEMFLKSPVDGGVYAIRFNNGLPRTVFINKNESFSIDLQKLLDSFPHDDVYPTSFSKDGRLALYVVSSDIKPAEFYLFDRDTGKASLILSAANWFKSEDLAVMTPVKFKARDGLKISAFVTVPKGSSGKNLPVVINPHGGPFGVFDTWGFNSETQMLANRGYAVMQVNFRGSGNYGKTFTARGYGQWGRTMQDDLTDATRWLVRQGVADPKRICIYGASYGAYAALMGAAKEPDLYRCAVGNVGVYDMTKMYRDDSEESRRMRELLDLYLGKKEDYLDNSPNRLAAKIKIPVMLAAGEVDTIAPPEHTKLMHSALIKNGIPVEMVIYPKEGHGNSLMPNKLDFAERLLNFLNKHIGNPVPANP